MSRGGIPFWTLDQHQKLVDELSVSLLIGFCRDQGEGAVNLHTSSQSLGLVGDALSQGLQIPRPRTCDKALLGHLMQSAQANPLLENFLAQLAEAIQTPDSVLGGLYQQYLQESCTQN